MRRQQTEAATADHGLRGRPSRRAQAMVRQQLANGPKRGEEVQAAAYLAGIAERSLIAAAEFAWGAGVLTEWDRDRTGTR